MQRQPGRFIGLALKLGPLENGYLQEIIWTKNNTIKFILAINIQTTMAL